MRIVSTVAQPTSEVHSKPALSTGVVNVLTALDGRITITIENPITNSGTAFFKWDADPTSTDYKFSLPPGGRATMNMNKGDYTQGNLRAILSVAGPESVQVTEGI